MNRLAALEGRQRSGIGTTSGGASFLEADTQVCPAPGVSTQKCTDTTAVTGPPLAMDAPRPRSRPGHPRASVRPGAVTPLQPPRRRSLRSVRQTDTDTTAVRARPLNPALALAESSGDKVNRLKLLLRQHRGDFEAASRGAPAPRRPSSPEPPREVARLVRQHRTDFNTREDLAPVFQEPTRPAQERSLPKPPPLPARCKPATDEPRSTPAPRLASVPTPRAVMDTEPAGAPVIELHEPAARSPQLAALTNTPAVAHAVPQLAALADPAPLPEEPLIPIHLQAPVEAWDVAPNPEPAPVHEPAPARIAPAPPTPVAPAPAAAEVQPWQEPVAAVRSMAVRPVAAPHPLDFAARPADDAGEFPWSFRAPGQARQLRAAPPTVRVEPLEFSESDLFPVPRSSRRRRQAALATVLGLLGTLAVVAAVFLVGAPAGTPGGTIEVRSVPAGATVKFNGAQITGTTPVVISVSDLSQEHELQLTLAGYQTWRDEVRLSRDEPRLGIVATMSPRSEPAADPDK